MFRINLLPSEVRERRRYEGLYRWVFILAAGVILIILGVYVLLMFEVASKNSQLQATQESATQQRALAGQLSIFQNKEQELQTRQGVAQTALAARVNIGQVAEDVSLVLPDEVWLDLLTINESTGIVLTAQTPRTSGESDDVAYKSVAKTLVRMNELPELYDVWLTTAINGQWQQWAASAAGAAQAAGLPVNVVTFQVSTKVNKGAPGTPRPAGSASATQAPAAAAAAAASAVNSGGAK